MGSAESLPERSWRKRMVRSSPFGGGAVLFLALPLILPDHLLTLMVNVLIYAIFAMSLDIIMGYTGMLSLGHAAFFGAGGYTVGILMIKFGLKNFWVVAPLGILAAAVLAAILGIIALRVSGIYFLLVTFALGMLLESVASKWYSVTRGTDGLAGLPKPILGIVTISWNDISFYYFVFVVFALCFFLMHRIVHSPFGEALQGIRESEARMQALGYDTWLYKYLAFILGGLFAGVGGILFAHHNSVITPYHLSVVVSTLAMLICIIGGPGTLWGPVIGTLIIVLAEYFSSIYAPQRWPLVLGLVFVLTVMFLRGGVATKILELGRKVSDGSVKS